MTLENNWKTESSKIDANRNNLPLLWVFADFIKPTMFGPTMLPLLRMVPVQAEFGVVEHSAFSLQHYVRVNRTRLQEFGVTIREHWDGPPTKIYGEVVLVLHFRAIE